MFYEGDKIKERWTEYGTQLFSSDQSVPRHAPDEHPPEALESEVMPSEIRAANKETEGW